MKKIYFYCYILFATVLFAGESYKPLDLALLHHQIGFSLLEYEDPTGNMTIEQVRQLPSSAFTSPNKAVPSHFFPKSAFWYRFDVENKLPIPVSRLLVFEPPWLDSVGVTIDAENTEVQSYQGGNTYPFSQRCVKHYLINFNPQFEPGISRVHVRVHTRDPFIVSLSIYDKISFFEDNIRVLVCTGFLFGGIIVMLFYNLFLYFGTKENYFAFYVAYLAIFILMNAAYNGYTFAYLLPDSPTVQNWLQSSMIFLFALCALLFANSFLHLARNHPKLHKITVGLFFIILGTALVFAILNNYRYHVIASIAMVIIVSIYKFSLALYSCIRGNRYARFFLFGVSSGLVGSFITALTVASFIPYTILTYRAVDIGIFIDAVLLSVALADRMRTTHEKRIIAEKEAKTDELTGLGNRRAYDEVLSKEYQKLLRYHRVMSMVMFDVDEFKKINDSFGHQTGDLVLQHIAALTRHTLRDNDYAFRIGGDEFLLLLPETNGAQAAALSERLRKAIETKEIVDTEGNVFFVTASFGVVEHTQREKDTEELIKRADEALYQSKEMGRNRVTLLDKYTIIERQDTALV